MTETLTDYAVVLHADLLYANFAFVTLGLLPGSVVADDSIRFALSTDHEKVLGVYLMVLEELLDDAAGDGGGVYFRAHHTIEAEIAVIPEDGTEFR